MLEAVRSGLWLQEQQAQLRVRGAHVLPWLGCGGPLLCAASSLDERKYSAEQAPLVLTGLT